MIFSLSSRPFLSHTRVLMKKWIQNATKITFKKRKKARWKAIASFNSDAMTVTVTDASFLLLTRSANKDRSEIVTWHQQLLSQIFLLLFFVCLSKSYSPLRFFFNVLSNFNSLSYFPPSLCVSIQQVSEELEMWCLKTGQVWHWRLNTKNTTFLQISASLTTFLLSSSSHSHSCSYWNDLAMEALNLHPRSSDNQLRWHPLAKTLESQT